MSRKKTGMLTRWLPVGVKQISCYGDGEPITSEEWCAHEKHRLAKMDIDVRTVYKNNGSGGKVVGLEYGKGVS